MKKWAIGALGTVIVALLAAWMIHLFGPNPAILEPVDTSDELPGDTSDALKEETLEEKIRVFREKLKRKGMPPESIEKGEGLLRALLWIQKVSLKGENGKTYSIVINDVKHRAYVGRNYYTNQKGVKCRNITHVVTKHPNWVLKLERTYQICKDSGVPKPETHD